MRNLLTTLLLLLLALASSAVELPPQSVVLPGIDEESMKVVDEIAATSTDANDKPLSEWRIKSITVDTQGYTYKPTRIEQ